MNGQVTDDKKIISNGFNSYFVNMEITLSKQIPADHSTSNTFMERNSNCMTMLPVTATDLISIVTNLKYDDVIKWKNFPRYWPFVRGIHRSQVNSLHKGQ